MEQIKRELELATLPEMPKRLDYRIGIIGAGFIVRNCHLEAYRKAVSIRWPSHRWTWNRAKK